MEIFQFIRPNECDSLNELHGIDLQYLLLLLNDYYIELRDTLNIDKKVTFGFEFEFEKLKISKLKMDEKLYSIVSDLYFSKLDNSVPNGFEISTPILTDTKSNWNELSHVCNLCKEYADVGSHAGGHIHIGSQILGSNEASWLNFIKVWAIYENIIYRFCYGEYLEGRQSIEKYAYPQSYNYYRKYQELKYENCGVQKVIAKLTDCKRLGVNLNNINGECLDYIRDKNTIEFRCPNASLQLAIWQNNLNLLVKLLEYSKTNINHNILDNRYEINNELNIYSKLDYYGEIYLDEALEFADLIFDNNLDKINFLKQYLKSFKVASGREYSKKISLCK